MSRIARCIGMTAALTVSMAAYADKPGFGETFTLRIGGIDHNAKTTFRSTREGRVPVDLSMSDLGMDQESTTVWAEANWQFTDRWGLSFTYSGFNSKGDVTTQKSGNFGDIEWEVNATLMSQLDLDLYIVNAHWDPISTERSHLGVGFGLHIADIRASIGATVGLDVLGLVIDPPIDLGTDTTEVTAPLPDFSLRGGHRFGNSWYLSGTAGYFGIKVNDIDGSLFSARGTLEWRPGSGRLGIGAGYQHFDIKVKDTGGIATDKYDVKFRGPVAFVSLGL